MPSNQVKAELQDATLGYVRSLNRVSSSQLKGKIRNIIKDKKCLTGVKQAFNIIFPLFGVVASMSYFADIVSAPPSAILSLTAAAFSCGILLSAWNSHDKIRGLLNQQSSYREQVFKLGIDLPLEKKTSKVSACAKSFSSNLFTAAMRALCLSGQLAVCGFAANKWHKEKDIDFCTISAEEKSNISSEATYLFLGVLGAVLLQEAFSRYDNRAVGKKKELVKEKKFILEDLAKLKTNQIAVHPEFLMPKLTDLLHGLRESPKILADSAEMFDEFRDATVEATKQALTSRTHNRSHAVSRFEDSWFLNARSESSSSGSDSSLGHIV